jgi:Fe2+ or Zn2+ uptake regulation protein
MWAALVIFKKLPQVHKLSFNGRKFVQSGHPDDKIIAIDSDHLKCIDCRRSSLLVQ